MKIIYDNNGGSGGGGGGNISGRTGSAAVGNGDSSTAVVFSTPFSDTDYALVTSFTNTVDGSPYYPQGLTTVKTAAGFTVSYNIPLDTGNYILEYIAGEHV